MREELKAWLNGSRNYDAGVFLLSKYGKNDSVRKLLVSKKLPDKLFGCIKKLFEQCDMPADNKSAQQELTKKPLPKNKKSIQLIDLEHEWRKHYKVMGALHTELRITDDIKKRFKIAKKIKDLEAECVRIWVKIDYFNAHGEMPTENVNEQQPAAINEQDMLLVYKRITVIRNLINYRKRELNKLNIESRMSVQEISAITTQRDKYESDILTLSAERERLIKIYEHQSKRDQ